MQIQIQVRVQVQVQALFLPAGVALTALRFGPGLAKTGLIAGTLTGPFGKLVDQYVSDPWLRRMIDLECFVLRYAKFHAETSSLIECICSSETI